ncbi:MAG: diguanylate cyclase [Firmicutes bacterium]|nr:diguanylate cyclase [Bacillota bacterium]
MNVNLRNKLKLQRVIAIAGLILVLLFAVMLIFMANNSSDMVEDAVIEKMNVAMTGQANSIELVVNSHYSVLKAIANHLEEEGGMTHIDHTREWMDDIVKAGDFYRLSITDGATMQAYYAGTAGSGVVNVPSDDEYYNKVKESKTWHIHGPYVVDSTGVATVVINVPVMKDGEVEAVVSGVITLEDFLELIVTEGKETDHSVYVVDSTGHIYIGSNKDKQIQVGGQLAQGTEDYNNILVRLKNHADVLRGDSIETFEENIQAGGSGSMIFDAESYENYGKGYLVYKPLPHEDWTLIYVKNESAVIKEFSAIKRENRMVIFAVILFCAAVMVSIVLIYRDMYKTISATNRRLQQKAAKYRLLEEFSKLESFEFDIKRRSYKLGVKARKRFGFEEFTHSSIIMEMIHPEDRQRYIDFENSMITGENLDDVEFRAKQPGDAKYYWMRIHPIEIKSETGNHRHILGYIYDVTKDQEKLQSALEKSERDFLTGLHTRESMENIIRNKLDEGKDGCHALILVDLDKFKYINDTFGHEAGDRALVDFAKCMRGYFRKEDYVGRFGGDEFLIFLPDIADYDRLSSRLTKFAELVAEKTENKDWDVLGCSGGIAVYPEDGATYEKLFTAADVAMYNAKKSDTICSFTKFIK